jgi:hypothetical protein
VAGPMLHADSPAEGLPAGSPQHRAAQ